MSKHLSPAQKRKKKIRDRDRKRFDKRWVCSICGEVGNTEFHHWSYCDVYDPRALIEVCPRCHGDLHGISRR